MADFSPQRGREAWAGKVYDCFTVYEAVPVTDRPGTDCFITKDGSCPEEFSLLIYRRVVFVKDFSFPIKATRVSQDYKIFCKKI